MPANLPPDYHKIEERYRAAKTPEEKIACIEEMMAVIPKHKGTDHLRADWRRKLARLREGKGQKGAAARRASAFYVVREGAGQVVLVGAPNVGKSALLAAMTNATPEVSEAPCTTWIPAPGMAKVENVPIQLVDTPSLRREYVEPELVSLIRRVDAMVLVIDLQAFPIEQLEETLAILEEHRVVPLRDDAEPEAGTRAVPTLVAVNKCDDEGLDGDYEVLCELLEEEWPMLPVSAETGRNLDRLGRMVFDLLDLVRVYSRPPGKEPDLSAPFVMKRGGTVEDFAGKVHKDFLDQLKSARVWGSATHDGQMVGRDHVLEDGDVVELRV